MKKLLMNCVALLLFPCFSLLAAEKIEFVFKDDPIDVVIPCVEKDLAIIDRCIEGIKKNGKNIRRVIVVSKKKLTDKAEWFNEDLYPFSYSEIQQELAQEDNESLSILHKTKRTGWYFQQLLKFYAPLVIPDISSNVLILDSDAIFLRPVEFLNEQYAGLYSVGSENHFPYFEHAKKLIPGFKKCFSNFSGISHHMLFQRPVIESLFSEVETFNDLPFWQAFCRHVSKRSLRHSGASEYEIYFNYVFLRSDQPEIRKLKWRNVRRFKEVAESIEKEFDYVCLHSYERVD